MTKWSQVTLIKYVLLLLPKGAASCTPEQTVLFFSLTLPLPGILNPSPMHWSLTSVNYFLDFDIILMYRWQHKAGAECDKQGQMNNRGRKGKRCVCRFASNKGKRLKVVLLWLTECRWRRWVEEVDRVCKCVCVLLEEFHLFLSALITGWADLKDCGSFDTAGRRQEVAAQPRGSSLSDLGNHQPA